MRGRNPQAQTSSRGPTPEHTPKRPLSPFFCSSASAEHRVALTGRNCCAHAHAHALPRCVGLRHTSAHLRYDSQLRVTSFSKVPWTVRRSAPQSFSTHRASRSVDVYDHGRTWWKEVLNCAKTAAAYSTIAARHSPFPSFPSDAYLFARACSCVHSHARSCI